MKSGDTITVRKLDEGYLVTVTRSGDHTTIAIENDSDVKEQVEEFLLEDR